MVAWTACAWATWPALVRPCATVPSFASKACCRGVKSVGVALVTLLQMQSYKLPRRAYVATAHWGVSRLGSRATTWAELPEPGLPRVRRWGRSHHRRGQGG